MAISFDGPNLLITLDSGVTQVDVSDIYSAWKQWMLAGDNSKYLPAFRTVGGDPLSSIINAGAYYFLRNDYGWRVKPPEEDITIYLTGNLAVQDTLLPAFIPTIGAYTAAVLGLQPVTQGVTPAMKSQLEHVSFEGAVSVDLANGIPLTVSGITSTGFPIGSPKAPVDNFGEAKTIADSRGLTTIRVVGNATLDSGDDLSGFKVVGQNASRTALTVNPASDTLGMEVRDAYITGTLDGVTIIRECMIGDLTYFNGFLFQCQLSGAIVLGNGAQANILQCYSGRQTPDIPQIDFGGAGQSLSLRGYYGAVYLTNKTGPESATIDLAAGEVRVDLSTVTNGTLTVRGDGKVIDQNGDWLPSGMYGNLSLINETNFGLMLQELWTLAGLDPDVPMTVTENSRVAGGINLAISGPDTAKTVTRQ